MGNHYPLLVETPEGNLVAGMKWLPAVYTERFNGRHEVFGHLFRGRYQAIVSDGSSAGYFEVVGTYIHSNLARAGLTRIGQEALKRHRWSSYPWDVSEELEIGYYTRVPQAVSRAETKAGQEIGPVDSTVP